MALIEIKNGYSVRYRPQVGPIETSLGRAPSGDLICCTTVEVDVDYTAAVILDEGDELDRLTRNQTNHKKRSRAR
jgi:hypothetical protein